jgi:hypothetical protein
MKQRLEHLLTDYRAKLDKETSARACYILMNVIEDLEQIISSL